MGISDAHEAESDDIPEDLKIRPPPSLSAFCCYGLVVMQCYSENVHVQRAYHTNMLSPTFADRHAVR